MVELSKKKTSTTESLQKRLEGLIQSNKIISENITTGTRKVSLKWKHVKNLLANRGDESVLSQQQLKRNENI